MSMTTTFDKQRLLQVLDELSEEQATEVFLFALFLRDRCQPLSAEPQEIIVKTLPATHLRMLVGTVAWGGDAVEDTERLYEL